MFELINQELSDVANYVLSKESYNQAINELSKDPEFIHQKGEHKGKINMNKMANYLGCSESTIKYNTGDIYKQQRFEHFEKQKLKKKEIGYVSKMINKRKKKNDPESIGNPESLRKIFAEELSE